MTQATGPDLGSIAEQVDWTDHEMAGVVRERLAGRPDAGYLAELAEWAVSTCPTALPSGFGRVRAVIVAGSAGGPARQLAETTSAVVAELVPLPADVPTALAEGVAAADQQIDEGADLLVVASPPEPVAATAAVALLTDTEPVKLLPRGAAATDPEAWMARAVAVRDLRRRCAPMRDAPVDLMTTLGSAPLAATAALLLRAAARRTPVVLDGSATAAAALLAYELQPRAVRWWTAADLGTEPGHEIALTRLGQRAILALGTDLSDGTAGMLAVLTLQTALQLARTDNPVAENGYS